MYLLLCDSESAHSVRCAERTAGCGGSLSNICFSRIIWGILSTSGIPYSGHMYSGYFGVSSGYDKPRAFSVRCLLIASGSSSLEFGSGTLCWLYGYG